MRVANIRSLCIVALVGKCMVSGQTFASEPVAEPTPEPAAPEPTLIKGDSESFVVLSEEALYAAAEVEQEIIQRYNKVPSLIDVCVVRDAVLPQYRLSYRNHPPVCVERPWRVMSWYFDIESRAVCVCE